jgi:hypothetical protein
MKSEKCISTYYLPKQLRSSFKEFAYRLGKTASIALAEAMSEYMRNHAQEVYGNVTINVINPTFQSFTLVDKVLIKASLLENKQELSRLINVVSRVQDEKAKTEFLVELAKRIQKAYEVYQRTKDEELGKLLAKCEQII